MSNATTEQLSALTLEDPMYGCTFLCGAAFPTTSEWRRHERQSHRQEEIWRCDVAVDDQKTQCGACFHRPSTLETHLATKHSIEADDSDLESGHIYPEHQHNFWCGFCVEIRELSERGAEAWTERYEHIEAHFGGEGMRIEEWLGLRR